MASTSLRVLLINLENLFSPNHSFYGSHYTQQEYAGKIAWIGATIARSQVHVAGLVELGEDAGQHVLTAEGVLQVELCQREVQVGRNQVESVRGGLDGWRTGPSIMDGGYDGLVDGAIQGIGFQAGARGQVSLGIQVDGTDA